MATEKALDWADAGPQSISEAEPTAGLESVDPGGEGASWPEPMAPEAFYGLAGHVVTTIEPSTEADRVALLLNFLGYFGNCAGLNPRFRVEDTDHGLNEFIGIVGATSKSRKGTADKRIRRLFLLVAVEWAEQRVKSGLSSGEGLIWAVRDPMIATEPKTGEERVEDAGETDKRLLIVESELATVLRRLEREGSSLSALMRNAWDRVSSLGGAGERAEPGPGPGGEASHRRHRAHHQGRASSLLDADRGGERPGEQVHMGLREASPPTPSRSRLA